MKAPESRSWSAFVAALLGLAIAVALTKLGTPIIFESLAYAPQGLDEALFSTWPLAWGYKVVIPCLLVSLTILQLKRPKPIWPIILPAAWLVWAIFSGTQSVAKDLSQVTLVHFAIATAFFYAGYFGLGKTSHDGPFWKVVILAFAFILWVGLEQHNGGLEATRKAFYDQPNWQSLNVPKEFILRIESNRIFSIFVYANAFAGALLLWAPALTITLWNWTRRLPSIAQKVVVGLFAYLTLACFFWTGSKAGWLIAIAVTAVGLLHIEMKRSLKIGIVSGVLILGLLGFAIKYRNYFEKGATSASARFTYWQAALKIARERPILGAGPGTFAKTFAPIKPPEAEMARLTHNDYLEQACDSGWLAAILYTVFIVSSLILGHRAIRKSPLHFGVWLGLLGWALQSFVEFGLYIPAIAWSAFILLGWLMANSLSEKTAPPPAR
jgi:hypothetical protein